MEETHYTQMKEAHEAGRTLVLEVGDSTTVYCDPEDSVDSFISKCKFAETLNLDVTISSGIAATPNNEIEDLLNNLPDNMPQKLKDILTNIATDELKNIDNAIEKVEKAIESIEEEEDNATKAKLAIIDSISLCLEKNNNRVTRTLITKILDMKDTIIKYHHLTPNMRACTITLPTGHEVIGVAQVLDSKNDVEEIGNKVALENATEKVWKVIGNIAKTIMDPSDG